MLVLTGDLKPEDMELLDDPGSSVISFTVSLLDNTETSSPITDKSKNIFFSFFHAIKLNGSSTPERCIAV